MSADLTAAFASLMQHHVATPAAPLPPTRPGVAWIWAGNGIFKRGVDQHRDVLIRVASTPPTPGLATLRPYVRFAACPERLPGTLLTAIYDHARELLAIEQQYFIVSRGGMLRVWVPPQEATASAVRYAMPDDDVVLIDIHSHHTMRAYFSPIDDRDDQGLSISAVIGRLDSARPELVLRANVYGHRQRLPADLLFATTGPFFTASLRGRYATAYD